MESLETKTGTETGSGKTAKITVTGQAEGLLDEMVRRVNDGFSGGRVTRQDVASWVIRYFHTNAFVLCVDEIRKDHFDQLAHLESLLKQAKEARRRGADSGEIASILGETSPAPSARAPRKRARKTEEQLQIET